MADRERHVLVDEEIYGWVEAADVHHPDDDRGGVFLDEGRKGRVDVRFGSGGESCCALMGFIALPAAMAS